MRNRTWITRDEIAGIHEQIAVREAENAQDALRRNELDACSQHLDHMLGHNMAAADIREIERIFSPNLRSMGGLRVR